MIDRPPFKDWPAIPQAWVIYFERLSNYAGSVSDSGTTANRPIKGLWVGRQYFDTDLGFPVWVLNASSGTWVDASGSVV